MDLTFNTNTDFDQTKVLITNIIKNTADDYDLFLSENSINNLSVHLTIAIIRIKSNNYIPMSNSQIASYKQDHSYPYAKMLCDRLAREFEIDFPEAEISLVSMYTIYQDYHKDFRNDDKLFVAIGLHLEPALERLANGQLVENPLKEKIIERHQEEFNYSKILNDVVRHDLNLSFDDDELAFIALHFVVANNRIDE